MKKIFTLFVMSFFALSTFAELAYNTTLTQNDFNNSQTVISKIIPDGSEVVWDENSIRCGGTDKGAFSGPAWNWDDKGVVVALAAGVPNQLSFQFKTNNAASTKGATDWTAPDWYVDESADGSTWTNAWTINSNTTSFQNVTANLKTTTRYIRLYFSGNFAGYFKNIKVTEQILMGNPSVESIDFGTVKVEASVEPQEFTINYTGMEPTVTVSDNHFTATPASFGSLYDYKVNQTISVALNTAVVGTYNGTITIEGRGLSKQVAVSGTVEKYNQTITWNPAQSYNWDDAIAVATASSNLAVSYEISDPTVLKFENGAFVKLHAGNVTVTAKQAGSYKYNAAANVAKTFAIVGPATSAQETKTITCGAQQTWHGYDLSTYTVGTHTLTYVTTNAQGGVHTITLTLTVIKQGALELTKELEFCEGDSAEYRGVWYKEEGNYPINITGAARDTAITVVVTVNEPTYDENETTEYAGTTISFDEDGWLLRGETAVVNRAYATTKADTADLWFIHYGQTLEGCEAVEKLIVEIEILDPVELEKEIEFCEGDSAEYRGVYYAVAGEYPVVIEDAIRDTMINVIVTVHEKAYAEIERTVLAGEVLTLPAGEWMINETTVSGEYQTLRSDTTGLELYQYDETEFGCESVVKLIVTVTPNYEAIENVSVDAKAEKFFRNGVLYIRRGEQIFTATGDRVE